MSETKIIRSKWLTIRLNEEEEKKLVKFYNRTTSNSLSEYARDVLLKEPVTILYRNATADDFLEQMIALKAELNAIGSNFNQAVHRLHTLDHIPEIRTWAILNEASKKILQNKVEEIMEKASEIYKVWSQK
jgi:hypothetical protein